MIIDHAYARLLLGPEALPSFYKDCNSGLNGLVNIIKTKILINATNCKADYIFDRNKVST